MKRFISLLLTLAIVMLAALSLASCGRVEDGTYTDGERGYYVFDGRYFVYTSYMGEFDAVCRYWVDDGKFYVSVEEIDYYGMMTFDDDMLEAYCEQRKKMIEEKYSDVDFVAYDEGIMIGDEVLVRY